MVEFLGNIIPFSLKRDLVYFHQALAEEWLFFVFLIKKRKVFAAEQNSGLHKRSLLQYHEFFPILVFEGSLSIEMALLMISKGYHCGINLGIISNFHISIDHVYPGSLPKDLLLWVNSGESKFSLPNRSSSPLSMMSFNRA